MRTCGERSDTRPSRRVCALTLARTQGHLLLLALADLDGVEDVDLAMVEVDGEPFATETVDIPMRRYRVCGVAHRGEILPCRGRWTGATAGALGDGWRG